MLAIRNHAWLKYLFTYKKMEPSNMTFHGIAIVNAE